MKISTPLIDPRLGLSLIASPFLLSLLAVQFIGETLFALGQTSEEIFRGDRLPILIFPHSESSN